jgi:CheY-like chemotaxis protein
VLILSKDKVGNLAFEKLVSEKNYDVVFDAAFTVAEVLEKLRTEKYDCFIADIGSDITAGITQLTAINATIRPGRIPTIIYLDSDITAENELALKKLSDVVVRKSTLSNNRLTDELELFLYKVQENNTRPQMQLNASISNDETLQKKKVLLVDDDMRNIFALSAALEEEKMEVMTAGDGREALDVLSKNKDIDIVLMDVMMPELDGYDTIRYIRNKMHLVSLPVIALTAKAMAGDREKCIEAGASDYISKPVETQKLVSLMRVWLS